MRRLQVSDDWYQSHLLLAPTLLAKSTAIVDPLVDVMLRDAMSRALFVQTVPGLSNTTMACSRVVSSQNQFFPGEHGFLVRSYLNNRLNLLCVVIEQTIQESLETVLVHDMQETVF